MGFRRESEKARAWRKWIAQNREMLIRSGIPDFVYSDEPTWFRFLEDGGLHLENGWRVEMLPRDEAAIFSDFIKSEYGEQEYRCLFRSLEDMRR